MPALECPTKVMADYSVSLKDPKTVSSERQSGEEEKPPVEVSAAAPVQRFEVGKESKHDFISR